MYNYFPSVVKRHKNVSEELTYIMNSNKRGNFNEKIDISSKDLEIRGELDLLSRKIELRFQSIREAFLYFDNKNVSRPTFRKDDIHIGRKNKLSLVLNWNRVNWSHIH